MPTRLVLQGTKVTSGQCLGLDKGVACHARATWAKWGSREAPGLLLRLSGHWTGQDWYGVSAGGLGFPGTGKNWVVERGGGGGQRLAQTLDWLAAPGRAGLLPVPEPATVTLLERDLCRRG